MAVDILVWQRGRKLETAGGFLVWLEGRRLMEAGGFLDLGSLVVKLLLVEAFVEGSTTSCAW